MSLLSTSRVLSPILTADEKQAWAAALRLNEIDLTWMEKTQQEILRASRWQGGIARATLETPEDGALWIQSRLREVLIHPPKSPNLGVWDSLLPHPLNRLPLALGKGMEISPAEERVRWVTLYEAFSRWEASFKRTEFSVVFVEGALAPTVLFHFVQGRSRACGSARHLEPMLVRYRAGQLTPEDLLQHFGGQSSVHALRIPTQTEASDPLEALASVFNRAAQGLGNKIEFRFRSVPLPDLEL